MSKATTPLPSTVRVGPYNYRVSRPKKLYTDDGSTKLWGQVKFDPDQHIRVWRDAPTDRAWTTLLHEALHAIDDLVSLDLTEEQVTRLAPALHAFLRDNGFTLPSPNHTEAP